MCWLRYLVLFLKVKILTERLKIYYSILQYTSCDSMIRISRIFLFTYYVIKQIHITFDQVYELNKILNNEHSTRFT